MEFPKQNDIRVAVVGLGYVGLPLAVVTARHWPTIGYDIDTRRVGELAAGFDRTGEVAAADLQDDSLRFTANLDDICECNTFVVAVPTPISTQHYPDLEPLKAASREVGRVMRKGSVVIYESTVFPGATEQICAPLLEQASGLTLNREFWLGYSPERINPGDRTRPLEKIVKLTSGSTGEAASWVDQFYSTFVTAGTHRAASMAIAEAAKAIENTQRDVNIALVNELAMMFARMGLDVHAILDAAGSKWNFLPFKPGLVGGHCIGVDPYYLVHKANEHGYYPELILSARRINNGMADYVARDFLSLMARHGRHIVGARILVLGIAFKENCGDMRNTQVATIVRELETYNARVDVHDPWVDEEACATDYGIELVTSLKAGAYDAVMVAVAHRQFGDIAGRIRELLKPDGVVYDVKQAFPEIDRDGGL